MTLQLAEPILFLQGMDHHEYSRTPAILRGSLVLRVTKPTKIKAISLTFRGRARTEWPEGIPPKKTEYYEEKQLMKHTWPFFNAQFAAAEHSHCADSFQPRNTSSECSTILGSAISHLARSSSPIVLSTATPGTSTEHKMALPMTRSRSFSKGELFLPENRPTVAHRGYRVFQPGEYAYNFELALDSCIPETINVDLGSVKYELDGCIERPGAWRSNLTGKKEVTLVRVPSEANLEQTEPIAISRMWEDQLHYDIVISGKAFPLGSSIPIAFKLTPLAKVRCHRIKIFITENVEYSCKSRKVQRLEPSRKILLFEKRAEAPATTTFEGSTVKLLSGGGICAEDMVQGGYTDVVNGTDNLLGDLTTGSPNVGPTEMEFNVQLPGCNAKERERLHCDTSHRNIQVHHWIKVVMRLSKQDPNNPSKRRHFEISIDSPFQILSCRATNANTTLPAYNISTLNDGSSSLHPCQCPSSGRRNPPNETAMNFRGSCYNATSMASERHRPRQLSRIPSAINPPPPFDANIPLPIFTPPPTYENVVGGGVEGLADYFARLADETTDDVDEVFAAGVTDLRDSRWRPMPPLTPGGRVARSMDEIRLWGPIGRV